jgi:hypothetical protein
MKKILTALIIAASLTFGFGGMALAQSPTDSAKRQVCEGISGQVGGSCTGEAGGGSLLRVVDATLKILSWIAGIAAVIMIVVSGLKYITSGGDSGSIASAKQSLIYAIVGIAIVALAQSLVIFVTGRSLGR